MRAILVVLFLVACGGHPPPPKRGVVESDLGDWKFKRFQGPMFDIEVWIEGNKAETYTASYITNDADKRGKIDDKDLVSVSVTKYDKPDGVTRATVKLVRRLASERGYQVEEDKIKGARSLRILGNGEGVGDVAGEGLRRQGRRARARERAGRDDRLLRRAVSVDARGRRARGAAAAGPDDAPKAGPKEAV